MSSDIADQIRQLFAATRPPHVVSDQPNDEGVSEYFAGTHWHDHGFESLDRQTTFALRMFTPQAVVFFLPAFLLAALERPESGLADGVAEFLVPPKDNPRRASYWSWWSLLNPGQRSVALQVLKGSRAAPNHVAAISALESAVHAI